MVCSCSMFVSVSVTTIYVKKEAEEVYNALLLDCLTVHDLKLQVLCMCMCVVYPTTHGIADVLIAAGFVLTTNAPR